MISTCSLLIRNRYQDCDRSHHNTGFDIVILVWDGRRSRVQERGTGHPIPRSVISVETCRGETDCLIRTAVRPAEDDSPDRSGNDHVSRQCCLFPARSLLYCVFSSVYTISCPLRSSADPRRPSARFRHRRPEEPAGWLPQRRNGRCNGSRSARQPVHGYPSQRCRCRSADH